MSKSSLVPVLVIAGVSSGVGYVHLHFGSNPALCRSFVEACARQW
jgi:hypothetical protein